MKRLICFCIVLIIVTGLLVSCNGTGKEEASSKPEQKSSEVTESSHSYEGKYMLKIDIDRHILYAEFMDNSSADAFIEKLEQEGELRLFMTDYGGFEKVAPLPWELPTNDERITTEPGDIILYLGNNLTIYYDENTWDFTRIAHIVDTEPERLRELLGIGNVDIIFTLEENKE